MLMMRQNKQNMYYSKFVGQTEVYKRDEYGNIVYTEVTDPDTGITEREPVVLGTNDSHYSTPIPFEASISSHLNELQMRSWGIDTSAIYSQIDVAKGYLPLEVGDLVWRENSIEWEDEENQIPKASSADYTCKGLMTEGLYEDLFLVQRNADEGNNNG